VIEHGGFESHQSLALVIKCSFSIAGAGYLVRRLRDSLIAGPDGKLDESFDGCFHDVAALALSCGFCF
jgi:hypothetical protein